MDMNNVKAITLPDGSKVKKIKNNNGQIIWADDTKYPYRQLEWINFTGAQYFSLGSTWTLNKAYGINVIRDATDPNIGGILASNNDSYGAGGYICNIQTNSQGLYFTYKAGNSTSPNYVLNDYLPNNSKRTFWTYLSNNLIVLDVRDANGNVIGNDEFTRSGGTWPGSNEVIIGTNLKGIKIRSLKIADATVSSGPTINVGTITSEILPCQRKSDGKLGFYMTSDNTFHPLSGTTTSANIGPTADEYPDKMSNEAASPYRLLEYIDIPADAYLNLNSQGNSSIGLKLDINFNPTEQSTQNASGNVFGSIYYDGSTYYRYHITSTNNGLLQVWFGAGNFSYKDSDIYSNDNNRHLIELNMHSIKDKKLYVDNVDKGTYTSTSTINTGLLYLGARRFNKNGNIIINNYGRTIRIYHCEIANDSYSVENPKDKSKLYPVQRKSDGKVGLLKVWKDGEAVKFCTSETSTDCIAGPTIQEDYEGTNWVD